MTIYEVQNVQKMPIWKQRIIECRSSGMGVKAWCKEHGLDFTTYYRWERKILTSIIPAEDIPGLPSGNLPAVPVQPVNAIVKVELASDPEEQKTIRFSANGFELCVPDCEEILLEEKKLKDLSPEKRKEKRLEVIKPIIDRFYLWCDQVDPRGATKKFSDALTYAKNQKESLCRFLEDGNIPSHNNRAENAIRPFVIGRKNWLFSQTANGARASADMYSLVETAKANGLDVFEYLCWLFRQITAANHHFTDEFLEKLMPWSEQAQENC